jgi:hypothetical protein
MREGQFRGIELEVCALLYAMRHTDRQWRELLAVRAVRPLWLAEAQRLRELQLLAQWQAQRLMQYRGSSDWPSSRRRVRELP